MKMKTNKISTNGPRTKIKNKKKRLKLKYEQQKGTKVEI
jgi:hypothetical protein